MQDRSMRFDQQKGKWNWLVPLLIIEFFVILSSLRHWEIDAECWGYWYFARVLLETGEFMLLGRSPLYAIYVSIFTWLEYPTSVILEYLVTTSFVSMSLFFFTKSYFKTSLSLVASILWIPYLYTAVPPTQALALGCICLAIVARRRLDGRNGRSLSYALFGLAYLFRGTYIVFLIAFIAWDFVKLLNNRGWKALRFSIHPRPVDLLLLIVIILPFVFMANQSPHKWNNAFGSSTDYFPTDGKSLHDDGFIQHMNIAYTKTTYGSGDAKDFYFTNEELFGGASTTLEAIKANPDFVIQQWKYNAIHYIGTASKFTPLYNVFASKIVPYSRLYIFLYITVFLISILTIYGAIRQSISKNEWLFLLCCVLVIIPTILFAGPKAKYMVSAVPVFIVAASWYSDMINRYVKMIVPKLEKFSPYLTQKLSYPYKASMGGISSDFLIGFVMVILFSNGLINWMAIGNDISLDIRQGDIRVLDRRDYIVQSFDEIEQITTNCQGVMLLEANGYGAFSKLPREAIYDIWEIPPYGSLDESDYNGLNVDRIDCLFISNLLQSTEDQGSGTNFGIRYQNYIQPYEQELLRNGASTIEIPGFGRAVILNPS